MMKNILSMVPLAAMASASFIMNYTPADLELMNELDSPICLQTGVDEVSLVLEIDLDEPEWTAEVDESLQIFELLPNYTIADWLNSDDNSYPDKHVYIWQVTSSESSQTSGLIFEEQTENGRYYNIRVEFSDSGSCDSDSSESNDSASDESDDSASDESVDSASDESGACTSQEELDYVEKFREFFPDYPIESDVPRCEKTEEVGLTTYMMAYEREEGSYNATYDYPYFQV